MVAFRLQTVLNVRKIEEEKLQGELASFVKSVLEAERKLNFLRFQKSQSQRMLHAKQREGMTGVEIAMYDAYLQELSRQISSQKEILRGLMLARDKKREELIEASKRRKILEKLKERKIMAALNEELKKHQNFIDEMGITRHARSVTGERKEI